MASTQKRKNKADKESNKTSLQIKNTKEGRSDIGRETLHSRVTTSSSFLRTPTNSQKVEFEKYMRKSCTFLNIRLYVAQSKKVTSTVEATREVVVTLFKILLDVNKTVMLTKYTRAFDQGGEEAIEKIDLPTTIGGLKRYAKGLQQVKRGEDMT